MKISAAQIKFDWCKKWYIKQFIEQLCQNSKVLEVTSLKQLFLVSFFTLRVHSYIVTIELSPWVRQGPPLQYQSIIGTLLSDTVFQLNQYIHK